MAGCDDPRQVRLALALRANLRRRKAAAREGDGAPPPGADPSKDDVPDPPARD